MSIKECLNKYLGIQYVHLGRTLTGLDCYGLIVLIYKDIGYDLIDLDNYNKNWSIKGEDLFIENYQKQWEKVLTPQLFDMVLFKGAKGLANHAGIYLDSNRFLHCIKAGVVVGKFSDTKWAEGIVGNYRLRLAFKMEIE